MHSFRLSAPADQEAWRDQARNAIAAGLPPHAVEWQVGGGQTDLFTEDAPLAQAPAAGLAVPRAFFTLAGDVVCHRAPERFLSLYRLLWRMARGEKRLLEAATDPDVLACSVMAKAVRRDVHKMKAFVRFRSVLTDAGEWFFAWFEPSHFIVERAAPFFVDRFTGMRWSILTPDRSAHWTGADLVFTAGARRADAPDADALEEAWRSYYASIFNPARLKPAAMRAEMPKKYWKNLPEASLIAPLSAAAVKRTRAMLDAPPTPPRPAAAPVAKAPIPARPLDSIRRDVAACRSCPLWEPATRAVPGEGPADARLMLIGEQPGDQEDLAGRPFAGPAGAVLDRALGAAGIDRGTAYVTNAVKHFKFVVRGKRRIHQKPTVFEIDSCRHWLDAEIDSVDPGVAVLLGATAGRAVFGRAVAVERERGRVIAVTPRLSALLTVHPSYLLRLQDPVAQAAEFDRFVADLRTVARAAA